MADADFLRKQAPSEIFEPPKTEKSGVPPSVLFQHSIRVRSADCLVPGGATESEPSGLERCAHFFPLEVLRGTGLLRFHHRERNIFTIIENLYME